MVLIEGAGILGDDVQRPAKGTEAPSIDAVAVSSSIDVRPSLMDRAVDHEGCRVEEPDGPTVDNLAFLIHLNEIGSLDEREGDSKRVDPEGFRVDWVL